MRHLSALRGMAIVVPVSLLAFGLSATAQAQSTAPSGAAAPAGALTAAQARALSQDVTDKVIVVFRNQLAGLPDTVGDAGRRTAAVRSVQAGVLAQLAQTHARNVKSISLVNAVAATVSPGEAKVLAASPAVARVLKDEPVPVLAAPPSLGRVKPAAGIKPLAGACEPKSKVQLDPEAIERIHAATQSGRGDAAQALGYTGAGVKVGWIADGLDPDNPDFIRADGKHVFVDYQDFSGTGTDAPTDGAEAFLDASSIAAQGRHVYNVAGYGVGLSVPCRIRILGVAPGASLVGLNVFGSSNVAFNSVFLEAISYAVTVDHVNVLNESFGSNSYPDDASLDLTRMADDAAVRAGVTVTVSTGDAGPTDTIGSPGSDPHVISAGATTTYRAYAQTGIGGVTYPGVKGWLDNNISGLSSGGFTQDGSTVDVVAPGDLNWALCTPKPAEFAACTNFAGKPASVELEGGTSEAAPLTAGVAALVIQAYARTHHGQRPSPAVVKRIIVSTAQNIDAPADQQGAGMIDAYQAVLAAASYRGSTRTRTGQTLLDSATQLNATGEPRTTRRFAETLTNRGHKTVTLALSSRKLGSYHAVLTRTLTLKKTQGFSEAVHFTVARKQARLNVSAAMQGIAQISLISPGGRLAEYNLPQGDGHYGNAQVADPAAGRWTALVEDEPDSGANTRLAKFQASTAHWSGFGRLSRHSLRLRPGGAGTVWLTATTPSRPGDGAGSVIVRSSAKTPSFAAVTSIPVTLRSLIPAPTRPVSFTGTLTGGNGRGADTGQAAYYQLDVPAGLKALNVSLKTPNKGDTFFAELVDPSGMAVSTADSGLRASATSITAERGAQLHVLKPRPGRWALIVDFYNSVPGTAVSQPFTVRLNDIPVRASVSGLPDSPATQLAAGTPVTVKVKVTNNGPTPEEYFVDARLHGAAVTERLVQHGTQGASPGTLKLPNLAGVVPEYLVPSHTTQLQTTVSASAPLFFDYSWPLGDPDLISSAGKTATGTLAAPDIPDGFWTVTPFLVGPDGAHGAKQVTATVSMTARTAAFDPAVTAPTGDLWLGSSKVSATFEPVVVKAGQSVTIPVTITPRAAAGSAVSGTLYVDDTSLVPGEATYNGYPGNFPEGSDVAAFGYAYTVK